MTVTVASSRDRRGGQPLQMKIQIEVHSSLAESGWHTTCVPRFFFFVLQQLDLVISLQLMEGGLSLD
jgi:hypothetical protein